MSMLIIMALGNVLDEIIDGIKMAIEKHYKRTHNKRKLNWK